MNKADFIRRADSICEKADVRQIRVRELYLKRNRSAERSRTGQVRLVKDAALPPVKRELEELNGVGLPRQGTLKAKSILEGYERALAKVEVDPGSVVEGHWPFREAEREAKKFGFRACALPG